MSEKVTGEPSGHSHGLLAGSFEHLHDAVLQSAVQILHCVLPDRLHGHGQSRIPVGKTSDSYTSREKKG